MDTLVDILSICRRSIFLSYNTTVHTTVYTTSDCTLANFLSTISSSNNILREGIHNLQNFKKKEKGKINNQKNKITSNSQTKFNTFHIYIYNSIFQAGRAKQKIHVPTIHAQFHAISYSCQGEAGRCGTVQTSSQTYFRSQNPSHSRSPRSHGSPLTPCQLVVV